MYQEATEPLSIGGVLDKGFGLFRASLGHVFVLAVIAALLSAPLNRVMGPGPGAGAPEGGQVLGIFFGVVGIFILSLILYGAIIVRLAAVSRGEPVPLGDALKQGGRRAPLLLLAGFCYALVIFVGLILLIIPGLWLMVSLMFAFFAVVLEKRGPIDALMYSYRLVRGHWWRTTGLLTVVFFIVFVIYLVVGLTAAVAAAFNPELLVTGVMPWYVDYIIVPLLTGLVYPLTYGLMYAVYRDLQLRHEGGDLAARIAAASP